MHGGLSQFKALLNRRKDLASQRNPRSSKSRIGGWEKTQKVEFDNPEQTEFELKKKKDIIRKRIKGYQRRKVIISYSVVCVFLLVIIYLFIKYG